MSNTHPKTPHWRRILFRTALILALLNLILVITGHSYFYPMLANTVFKGKLNPGIDEYEVFENREIKAGTSISWPVSTHFNGEALPQEEAIRSYGTVAFLLARHDSIRYERYWEDYGPNSHSNSFSMAKTIIGLLVGIAIEEGKIKSLDQPISDFLPQFHYPDREPVTVRHLVGMCSGFNFHESYINPFAFPARANYGDNLEMLMNNYQPEDEPGTIWRYQSGNTQLLGLILRKATNMTVSDYASEKLWKPLGANNTALWSLDREGGTEKAFCCFQSNARDFARIAQLILNDGKNLVGKQVVPADYLRTMVRPMGLKTAGGSDCNFYSLSWWLGSYGGYDYIYARGIQGQYSLAIPELDLVLVRLGHRWERRSGAAPGDLEVLLQAAFEELGINNKA